MDRSSDNAYPDLRESDLPDDVFNAANSSREASGLGSFVPTGRAGSNQSLINPFQISSQREGDDAFGAEFDSFGEEGDQGPNDQGQD